MKNKSYIALSIVLTSAATLIGNPQQASSFHTSLSQPSENRSADTSIQTTSDTLHDHAEQIKELSTTEMALNSITDKTNSFKKTNKDILDGKSNKALNELSNATDATRKSVTTSIRNIKDLTKTITKHITKINEKIAKDKPVIDAKIKEAHKAITQSDVHPRRIAKSIEQAPVTTKKTKQLKKDKPSTKKKVKKEKVKKS